MLKRVVVMVRAVISLSLSLFLSDLKLDGWSLSRYLVKVRKGTAWSDVEVWPHEGVAF
jgi:hypothetical protein